MTHFLVCVFLGKHEKCVASLLGLTPTKVLKSTSAIFYVAARRMRLLDPAAATRCCWLLDHTDTNFSTCVLELPLDGSTRRLDRSIFYEVMAREREVNYRKEEKTERLIFYLSVL